MTLFRVSKSWGSIFGVCQHHFSIFWGQQRNPDMDPRIKKQRVPPRVHIQVFLSDLDSRPPKLWSITYLSPISNRKWKPTEKRNVTFDCVKVSRFRLGYWQDQWSKGRFNINIKSMFSFSNCSFWRCELKPSEHACKIVFQLFETMCYQFVHKDSTLFTPKTRFLNEFSHFYWQESFDGDSFVSQSRFDVYAAQRWSGGSCGKG